ncbi:serine acetyltransferase [Blastococcus sp. TF02A-30]|nr:serine acetyltransferase [Blastococcus sp. TF02A-30]
MVATHPATLAELVVWMAEDARVNRRRGGGLSVLAVAIVRIAQFGARASGPAARVARLVALPLLAVARLLLGCEIPADLACGRRLVLAHGGRGVIVVHGAVLGDDVVMAPYASVGAAYPTPGAPVIGDRVYLGAHATVLGPVTIGDNAFLGARALVLQDLPAGAVALGTPAEVLEGSAA